MKDIYLLAQLLTITAISCFTFFAFANAVWLTFVMDFVQILYCLLTISLILMAMKLAKAAALSGIYFNSPTPSTT